MSSLTLGHYLALSAALFCIGLTGVLWRRNLIALYLSLELMLNAANISLVAFGRYHQNLDGQVLVFFVLTVAAAEVVVGLGLLVALFRWRQTTEAEELARLKF